MKKLSSLFALIIALSIITAAFCANAEDEYFSQEQIDYYKSLGLQGTTVNVYNWGDYISDGSDGSMDVVHEFERLTGAKVNYSNFESNENMYSKLIGGGVSYDVITPSDYMIERLAKEGFLQEVDKSKLTNMDKVIPGLLSQPFDEENRYSIPYFWGSVGILYDKTVVPETDLQAGWEVLKNPKYADNIYMYDSVRDSFMIALKALGYSLNTSDKKQLDEAYNWLIEQNNIMNPVYVGDEVIDSMISGNKAMAIVYSGDAAYIMSENENLGYFEPEIGTNTWIDGMVITKDSTQVELAHKFIDFMITYENSLTSYQRIQKIGPA